MGTPQFNNQGGAGGAGSSLADHINKHHHAAKKHARQAVLHARAAGELLLEAKNSVKHGEWLPWLETNFDGSQRTAHDYMRVARRWPQIEASVYSQRAANLTIREALRLARYGFGHKADHGMSEGRA